MILEHELARAAARVAVAAAGRGVDPDHVAFVHVECSHDGVLFDAAVGPDHLDVVRRALAAAVQRPRLLLVPRVRAGEEAAVRADTVVEHDSLASAALAFAAGDVVERELLHVEAVACLCHLGRTVERVAVEAAEHRVVAVGVCGAAPAAELRLDDREVAPRVRMRPADERAADRREAAGRQPVAEVRGEAAPDHVVQADLDLVVRRKRCRRLRVEDGARPGQQPQRLEVPGVRRRMRTGDVHEHHLRRDQRPVARGVVRAGILVGVVAQVDNELVVLDLDDRAVDDAAVLLLVEPEHPLG